MTTTLPAILNRVARARNTTVASLRGADTYWRLTLARADAARIARDHGYTWPEICRELGRGRQRMMYLVRTYCPEWWRANACGARRMN